MQPIVRPLIIRSDDAKFGDPFNFSVEIFVNEPRYTKCELKVMHVLFNEIDGGAGQTSRNDIFSYFVTSDIGKKLYDTNKKQTFIAGFSSRQLHSSNIGIQPRVELNGIPNGLYNFKIEDHLGNTPAMDTDYVYAVDSVVLICQLYLFV